MAINFNISLLKQLILFSPDQPCIEDQKEAPIGTAISSETNLVTTVEQCLNDYLEREMGCLLPWCRSNYFDMNSEDRLYISIDSFVSSINNFIFLYF